MSENIDNLPGNPSMQFVVLEGITHGNRFYSCNSKDGDPTKLKDGKVAYRVIGYADTPDDALAIIRGERTAFEVASDYLSHQEAMRKREFGDNVPDIINQMDTLAAAMIFTDELKRNPKA